MGDNRYGQLGLGNKKKYNTPQKIRNLPKIIQVTASTYSGALDY